MKKMLMGVLAMLLVLTMGTTVFAANSPGTDAALNQKAQEWHNNVKQAIVKGKNNTIYNVTKEKVSAKDVTSVNEVVNSISTSGKVLAMTDLSVKNVDTSKGVTVTISVDPTLISSGYNAYLLHRYGDGQWEVIKPSSISNGQVTFTVYSLSPVAVAEFPSNVSVSVSDPSKNHPANNNTNNNTNSSESSNSTSTNSHNTTGPSQSNSNSSNSSNSNNQSNSQTNNQNNPVNVNQNVTVKYPDFDTEDNYDNGYSDGYQDGRNSVKGASATNGKVASGVTTSATNGKVASGVTTSAGVLSPKTGASLPALPIVAVFALAGIVVCGKKAHANR